MSPLMKKILGAVAVKQIIDKVNERRAPKPSFMSRFGRMLLIGGGAAAGLYAYKSGALQPIIDKVSGGSSNAKSDPSSNGSQTGNDISFRSEDQPLTAPVN